MLKYILLFAALGAVVAQSSDLTNALISELIGEDSDALHHPGFKIQDIETLNDSENFEISDEDELEWGFIRTTIDKVKKALPKYVAKGKSAIRAALDKVKANVRGALKKAKAKFGEEEMDVEVFDTDKVKWGFIKKAIDHVKKNIPKYIAKGKAAINGALDKAKGWLKGALSKAKATFGEDEMDVEISDEDELEWGFIKTTIAKVKKALPKYVAKGKSAILAALDKVKANVRGALKKAKAKFGEEEMDVEVFDTDKVKWGFIKKAIDHVKKNIPKYIAKGKAAINGALNKAKGWLKGALKKAKATFGEDLQEERRKSGR